MFPGTTYEHSSGGEPARIPELTHEQLVNFHKTHYNPSNARFYTYGNFPLEDHLSAIQERLSSFKRVDVPYVNKKVTPWAEPQTMSTTCAFDPCKYFNSTLIHDIYT